MSVHKTMLFGWPLAKVSLPDHAENHRKPTIYPSMAASEGRQRHMEMGQ